MGSEGLLHGWCYTCASAAGVTPSLMSVMSVNESVKSNGEVTCCGDKTTRGCV